MISGKNIIAVIPLGDVPEIFPNIVAANLQTLLSLPCEILPSVEMPEYAFDKERLQYNSGTILRIMERTDFGHFDKHIAICMADLFIPIFTHVFGEAQLGRKSAVVSAFRLQNSPASLPKSLICERLAKIAIHEVGHLFNLHHCGDDKCLMHFSGNLKDLDKTPMIFCRYCLAAFRDSESNIL